MAMFYASTAAAYGAAIAATVETLRQSGAPDDQAYRLAETIVNDLARDGWQWRWREPPPPPRAMIRPADPGFLAAQREQLRLDLEAATAAHRAREKQPTTV